VDGDRNVKLETSDSNMHGSKHGLDRTVYKHDCTSERQKHDCDVLVNVLMNVLMYHDIVCFDFKLKLEFNFRRP
jgi:hypothetical protein